MFYLLYYCYGHNGRNDAIINESLFPFHDITRYIEKKVSLWLLCGVQHSVISADYIKPETQQPIIVIILITYSPYLKRIL